MTLARAIMALEAFDCVVPTPGRGRTDRHDMGRGSSREACLQARIVCSLRVTEHWVVILQETCIRVARAIAPRDSNRVSRVLALHKERPCIHLPRELRTPVEEEIASKAGAKSAVALSAVSEP